jgi:hypothetical protein
MCVGERRLEAVAHDPLAEDHEPHVPHERDPAPGHGTGPERGVVGDAARDGWQVRVRGGEEVQGDMRG